MLDAIDTDSEEPEEEERAPVPRGIFYPMCLHGTDQSRRLADKGYLKVQAASSQTVAGLRNAYNAELQRLGFEGQFRNGSSIAGPGKLPTGTWGLDPTLLPVSWASVLARAEMRSTVWQTCRGTCAVTDAIRLCMPVSCVRCC